MTNLKPETLRDKTAREIANSIRGIKDFKCPVDILNPGVYLGFLLGWNAHPQNLHGIRSVKMNNPSEAIKAFAKEMKKYAGTGTMVALEQNKLCDMVIEMTKALEKYQLSEKTQSRMNEVDEQTLRKIILHTHIIAEGTLTKLAKGLK